MNEEKYWQDYEVLKLQTWIDEFGEDQLNLNELKEYLEFIEKSAKEYDKNRYSEWHHVIPRCVDKDHKFDKELVQINGADHFRAHLVLSHCFNGKLRSLVCYALMRMKHNVVSHGEKISAEDWEKAVALYAKANSERQKGNTNNLGNRYHLDLTPEQREAKSNRMKGNQLGKLRTKETRERMSREFSGEGNPFYNKTHSDETKKIISDGRLGEKNPAYKKIWITNGEVDRRISEDEFEEYEAQGYYRGRTVSKEARDNMRKASLKRNRDNKGRWS